jgi:hypothetical protein
MSRFKVLGSVALVSAIVAFSIVGCGEEDSGTNPPPVTTDPLVGKWGLSLVLIPIQPGVNLTLTPAQTKVTDTLTFRSDHSYTNFEIDSTLPPSTVIGVWATTVDSLTMTPTTATPADTARMHPMTTKYSFSTAKDTLNMSKLYVTAMGSAVATLKFAKQP